MELIHFGNVKVAGEEIDSTRTSSAPIILQLDHITPWSSFYDAVSQDFKSESMNCFSVIKATWGWDALDERAASDGGLLDLSKLFRACKTLKYAYSIRNWLWTAFAYTAMVDYPTPANFLQNLPAYPVKEVVVRFYPIFQPNQPQQQQVLRRSSSADVQDHRRVPRGRRRAGQGVRGGELVLQLHRRPDLHGLDGWQWQKIEKVLKRFGSNIIFSNGMRDPWSRGGVLKNI
ncbi:Putative serine peptidase S28 family protein [Zea mays]|uniref:Putative serine peptidase S28 family protein n=1 Tax=Zea mays TaxID=4577 RepID=A0A1D6P500_MAIZE|nr:Putative serine peptidase S28 family protein [Zea mays]